MDFGAFIIFGLVAVALLIYAPFVIYLLVKRKRSRFLHATIAGGMALFLLFAGAFIYQIYFLDEEMANAAAQGDITTVKTMLARGASPNAEDTDGVKMALTSAAENGHANIVQLLLQRGADVRKIDGTGKTALQSAVAAKHPKVAQMLRSAGAKK